MKKIMIIAIGMLMIFLNAGAQLNTIQNVRAYANKVNLRIADALKSNITMYCNEVVVNKNKASWPGSGNYQKRISLWYSADPANGDTEMPETLLEKVMSNSEIAGEKYSEEYTFYNGQLIFYYQLNTYKENDVLQKDEHRLYFYKGQLFYYDLRDGSRKVSEETKKDIEEEAIRQGKNLVQLFLTSCN